MKIFLDDIRNPPDDSWVQVYDYADFVNTVYMYINEIECISFDHDLGENKTGYDCISWLEEKILTENWPVPELYVHTSNPSGRERIEMAIKNIYNKKLANVNLSLDEEKREQFQRLRDNENKSEINFDLTGTAEQFIPEIINDLEDLKNWPPGWNFGEGKEFTNYIVELNKDLCWEGYKRNVNMEIFPDVNGVITISFQKDDTFIDITTKDEDNYEIEVEKGIGDNFDYKNIGEFDKNYVISLLENFKNGKLNFF